MVSGGKCHLSQRANAHLVRACLCYFDIIKVDGIRLSEVIVPKIVQTIWKLVAGVASIVACGPSPSLGNLNLGECCVMATQSIETLAL